jgi:hypothetical protein
MAYCFYLEYIGLLGSRPDCSDPDNQTTKINRFESLPSKQGQLNRLIVLMDCVAVALKTPRKKYRQALHHQGVSWSHKPPTKERSGDRWAVAGLLSFF